jgi:hypothetical protein
MIDKSNYMTSYESDLLEKDMSTQVDTLIDNLNDKSIFRKKDTSKNISIVKEGDIIANE